MNDCPRAGKLFGCKFKPRFSVQEAYEPRPDAAFWMAAVAKAPTGTPKKTRYIRDVCERCGKTVER